MSKSLRVLDEADLRRVNAFLGSSGGLVELTLPKAMRAMDSEDTRMSLIAPGATLRNCTLWRSGQAVYFSGKDAVGKKYGGMLWELTDGLRIKATPDLSFDELATKLGFDPCGWDFETARDEGRYRRVGKAPPVKAFKPAPPVKAFKPAPVHFEQPAQITDELLQFAAYQLDPDAGAF